MARSALDGRVFATRQSATTDVSAATRFYDEVSVPPAPGIAASRVILRDDPQGAAFALFQPA